ncbi:MAG: serine hydrolase domain-containing protein [Pseudomonadota bacterium]
MDVSRRSVLATLPLAAVGLSGCTQDNRAERLLNRLIEAPAQQRASAAGLVVMRENIVIAQAAAGDAVLGERPFTPRSAFRAASISKLAVALCAEKLDRDGTIDLDQGIRNWLSGFPKTSAAGDEGPSVRALLSHTGGMTDPEVYWLAHPGRIETLLGPSAFRRDQQFEYCNLGYGIVATVLERAAGRRFDHLVRDIVFGPMGLDVGFNWAGVSLEKKRTGATLYRETETGWQPQIDDTKDLQNPEPLILKTAEADLNTYQPGNNGTLFSPQGGLRANLIDLATLAARLKYAPSLCEPVWTLNSAESNGVHDGRYYTQFGTGVQVHPAEESLWPGQTLFGHAGEAYGLYAGAWYAPDLDISFAFAVTGTPQTPPARSSIHPALNLFTETLMQAVIQAYETSPAVK